MALPTKIEIAQSAKLKPITEIAARATYPASEEMDINHNGITKGLA
jgi:hypothetical protein